MAIWDRAPSETKTQDVQEVKITYSDGSDGVESPAYEYAEGEGPPAGHTALHKGLGSRQITMIAIGGALGTGLIIGTGKALAQAGCAWTWIYRKQAFLFDSVPAPITQALWRFNEKAPVPNGYAP
ncbi:hypothetical protein LTR28_006046 [Elasticomyces elasticus]|nr:hypothetical protein LTR28_006046 [Elasticomyces elasticus]